ncbi:MAG: DUF3482 domain-containing protein [Verrucomicrobiota bacterium]
MPDHESASSSPDRELILSLISHTNVGKTALARTLLRRDVGEVADSAHVTVIPEAHVLLQSDHHRVMLWDTPGFGSNLAKLAKRLRSSKNPVGWILHQVWDRHRDKSLWCSQEAIRNVQAEADVVLYLVDASQAPDSVGFVDLEVEIIEWIGKPVLVFLNQTGQPDPKKDRENEEEWRRHFESRSIVRHVTSLDAFTRCWTQEHLVLEQASKVVAEPKRTIAHESAALWARTNLDLFEQATVRMTQWATAAVKDSEPLPQQALVEKFRQLVMRSERSKELERIQTKMYDRLARETAATVNDLISLHGLDGESASRLARSSRDGFAVKRDVEESLVTAVGGAVSGLVAGLSADLLAGGMTFGGGAIVGMLLGGATTFALARGYNLARTGQNSVRWTESHFRIQLKFIIMLYLAISHFGRGRGAWRDPEHSPAHWEVIVDQEIEANEKRINEIWKRGDSASRSADLDDHLARFFREALENIFVTLYPSSESLFRS